MNAAEAKAMYADFCRMPITIRRITNGVTTDYPMLGYKRAFGGQELIGTVVQGDVQVIVPYDELVAANFPLPITTADRVLADLPKGELRIMAKPGERRADEGDLVAFDLQARG